jgi:hypothetical protein
MFLLFIIPSVIGVTKFTQKDIYVNKSKNKLFNLAF